jgi:hypothetical protein
MVHANRKRFARRLRAVCASQGNQVHVHKELVCQPASRGREALGRGIIVMNAKTSMR